MMRLENVEVNCLNALTLINHHKNDPKVFMYLDSPYELSTRKTANLYDIEMDTEDQREYVNTFIDAKASILVSGYKPNGSSAYDRLLEAGWQCEPLAEGIRSMSAQHAVTKNTADEWIWFNF